MLGLANRKLGVVFQVLKHKFALRQLLGKAVHFQSGAVSQEIVEYDLVVRQKSAPSV